MNYCVALLLLCSTVQICISTSVFSEDGKYAKEELLDRTTVSIQDEAKEIETDIVTFPPSSKESEDSSSSEENSSNEEIKGKPITSDSIGSRSEEFLQQKRLKKRSLDPKPETVNSIGKTSNQTLEKFNNVDKNTTSFIGSFDSTSITEDSRDDNSKESSSQYTESTTKLVVETTTESKSEEGTTILETETTTERVAQTTEDGQDETTTEVQVETTETEVTVTESEREIAPDLKPDKASDEKIESTTVVNSEPTDESNTETTSEENQEAPENVSASTTEKQQEITQSSSEDSEELPYYSPSSTPSTQVESTTSEDNHKKTMMEVAVDRVNKLSDQIRLVLATYKKVGVVKIPGQSFFPEPMLMQDFRRSFSIGTMDFKNMRVYGLSNFTVEHINTDVDRMQVYILLHMKKLTILGNYTLRTFLSRAAGPFNVTLLNVDSEGVAEIQSAAEGHLEAADSQMDMLTQDMLVDFKNLGFMGSMFQGMISTVGDALFNSIKPQILDRVNIVIRTDVNKKLKEFSTKFINKVNPVDLAFSEGRKYVRNQGYDPYHVRDHTFLLGGLVYVNITEFWIEGLSRFYRIGNLSLSMDAGVIEISVHVITGHLIGHCHWSGQTFGIVKYGKTNFTVDHLQVRAMVHQSLDVRKKPQLNDLDLELGSVKVTMNSPMTLNLMIEGIINAFPRLIRHIIVDTLEQPLKEKIQEILDKINIEGLVDENLPRLDTFGL